MAIFSERNCSFEFAKIFLVEGQKKSFFSLDGTKGGVVVTRFMGG